LDIIILIYRMGKGLIRFAMLTWLAEWREKRQAQSFLKNIFAWYETSKGVSDLLGDALYDQKICTSEIGLVLDKTDRQLFALAGYISDARGSLRRWDLDLAQRFDRASSNIYRLRNMTVRFLIRCHASGPFADQGQIYYYQALEATGFQARQIRTEVEQELKSIWLELQGWIIQAEKVVGESWA